MQGLIPLSYQANNAESKAFWEYIRSEAALFDTGVRKGAFYVGDLERCFGSEFLPKSLHGCHERIRICGGNGQTCIGVMMSFCSILLFFKPHSPNAEMTLGVKANRSVAAAKRMNWNGVQCGVTAHLAIWKGYKIVWETGPITHNPKQAGGLKQTTPWIETTQGRWYLNRERERHPGSLGHLLVTQRRLKLWI